MKVFIQQAVREPLAQFLVIALVLLAAERYINQDQYRDPYQIRIDDQVLLQYLQVRARSYNGAQAEVALDGLSQQARQQLIEDYARDEVLYREALARNLDNNDQLIRRRLIQKMEYLAQGFYDDIEPLQQADLLKFYTANQQQYIKPAEITFTHVYLSAAAGEASEKKPAVANLLQKLNREQIPFEQASRHGERFLYNRNYVNRDIDEIGSHFGEDFQQQIFALQASDSWQGPIRSNYGWHLVLIKNIRPSYLPPFEQISSAVLADAKREQHQLRLAEAVDQLIAQYQISIETTE
ncbi:MAG: peptidyl-prolyl cis-trans isomerase [Porticoccaceae bacterium]